MAWFVYVLKCSNKTLYTGMTKDLARRLRQHNSCLGARYTRSFGPVKLLWSEEHPDQSAAAKREAQIKTWTRAEKLALIAR